MATIQTKNGGWVTGSGYNAFRAVLYYAVTTTATRVTLDSQLAVQSDQGHDSLSNFTLKLNGNAKSSSAYLSAGSIVKVTSEDGIVVNRTHAKQTRTLSAYAADTAYWPGQSSTASVTVMVDPLASYAVTFNANGGSGAPAAQTKWYGEALTLSTARPTRANYNFKGWATSSSASSAAYQPGGSYTGNAALTLYAVWELAAASPSVTALSAYRSDSSGTRIDDATADTTHVTVEYGWAVDSGATARTVRISLGGAAQAAIALAANSGTGSVTYERTLGIDATLAVSATLTDSTHGLSATRATAVPVVFKPLSMANRGLSAAFFGVAGAAWSRILKVFGSVRVQEDSITAAANPPSNVYGRGLYLCGADNADIGYARAMKVTDGRQGLQLEALRVVDGTNRYNTVNLLIDASGAKTVTVSDPAAWRSAIAAAASSHSHAWASLGSFTGTGSKSVSLSGYSELMVAAKFSSKLVTATVATALLTSSAQELWLGGGKNENANGPTYGALRAVCNVSLSSVKGVTSNVGGTLTTSSTTWYLYAR